MRLKAARSACALYLLSPVAIAGLTLGDNEHPTEIPSGRCLAAVDTYSRYKYKDSTLDVGTYSNPITEFYTKHPEYQGVPFPFLMEFLSDKKCSTADQLYQMALAGKLHVIRPFEFQVSGFACKPDTTALFMSTLPLTVSSVDLSSPIVQILHRR